ncbi:MAG: long-chain fatty acid--CoA ligase [Thermodesulfobacteriota bacterium]
MDHRPWHSSYAPGVPVSIEYEKITVPNTLRRSAGRFPHNTALNYMGRRISFARLESMVNGFCRALEGLGVRPGDRVAMCLPNIPQAIVTNMAVMRMGAVTVPVNPLYTERELAYQLCDAETKAMVTLALLLPRVKKIQDKIPVKSVVACHIQEYLPFPKKQLFPFVKKAMTAKVTPEKDVYVFSELLARQDTSPYQDKSNWEDLGALLYTGGTTGVSKGVMLHHRNLSSNVQQFASWFPDLEPGTQRVVGNYPVFHSAGFTAIQNFCLGYGHEFILVPRPEPSVIIEIIKKYKPTFLPGVPTIFVSLLNDPRFRKLDLSSIRGFFAGAAPLPAEVVRDLQSLTGGFICDVYGSTETAPIATVTPWGGKVKQGTVGIPVPDTIVKIVDLEDPTKEMPAGQAGEVAVRGPQIMAGYYKKPEETAKVLKDGWFYSGDIGVMDEDGYLSIVDRKKDMIIAGGYNIYPVEIDGILFSHPKVLEACTVGVPDTYRGETVKAFVALKPGETATEEEIIAFCKKNLAAYKVPKKVEFVPELPKTTVGKILRRKLRDAEMEKAKKAETGPSA